MRVLYLAPLLPAKSGSGGKRAVFNHLEELSSYATSINLVAVNIDDSLLELPNEFLNNRFSSNSIEIFDRGIPRFHSKGGITKAIKQLIFHYQPRAVTSASPKRAKAFVKKLLKEYNYDYILIDHLNAFGLLPFQRAKQKKILIAHNIESNILKDLISSKQHSFVQKIRLLIELLKTIFYENLAFFISDEVLFISSADLDYAKNNWNHKKFKVWPELLKPSPNFWSYKKTKEIVFVGSSNYFPNEDAILWLVNFLMRDLKSIDTSIKLRIVGSSAEQLSLDHELHSNIIFEGFVSDNELLEIQKNADLFICPVTLGSGIKIKILEASSMGIPIAATPESLNGIGYLKNSAFVFSRSDLDIAIKISNLLNDQIALNALSRSALESLNNALKNRPRMINNY